MPLPCTSLPSAVAPLTATEETATASCCCHPSHLQTAPIIQLIPDKVALLARGQVHVYALLRPQAEALFSVVW